MIDSRGQDNQIPFEAFDSNPSIVLIAYIKVARSLFNETNLLIRMDMLREEVLDLDLVIRQSAFRNLTAVLVIVASFFLYPLQNPIRGKSLRVQLNNILFFFFLVIFIIMEVPISFQLPCNKSHR